MTQFDPYHKWLGIPPAEQPPHHYRLLGLSLFEDDLDVIEAAADRQMAYVQQCALGEHLKESQQLLNELSAVRVCLLVPEQKDKYDKELRAQLEPSAPKPIFIPQPTAEPIEHPRPILPPAQRQSSKRKQSDSTEMKTQQRNQPIRVETLPTQPVKQPRRKKPKHHPLDPDVRFLRIVWVIAGGACLLIIALLIGSQFNSRDDEPQSPPSIATFSHAYRPSLLIAPFTKEQAAAKQQAWAEHLKTNVTITNSIGMKLTLIPPGEFMMGSPITEKGRSDDELLHNVRIAKPFYLATTELTQMQWQTGMETTPWKAENFIKEGDDYAATFVSWEDVQEFIQKLHQKEGATYRLPTEAEWEYTCRAGSESEYYFGNNVATLKEYAWLNKNTWDIDEKYAHRVGIKQANSFGLYDMHGNVYEWCNDRYDKEYYKQFANKTAIDPQGGIQSTYRVLRGGSWYSNDRLTRSASRYGSTPTYRNNSIGFRLVRVP